MNSPTTEAQEAVAALLVDYPDVALAVTPTLRKLLAVAYTRGALAAATEALESSRRA